MAAPGAPALPRGGTAGDRCAGNRRHRGAREPSRRVAPDVPRAWRIQREFFYDPNYHGLDLAAAEKQYEPFLERVASRTT